MYEEEDRRFIILHYIRSRSRKIDVFRTFPVLPQNTWRNEPWRQTVCCMYGHTYSKSFDQPGKVANPASGQLNRENEYFPVRVHA